MSKTTAKIHDNNNVSLSSFFILDKANEGREFPLVLPNGTPTPYHLTVLSRHSDIAATALDDFRRNRLVNMAEPEAKRSTDRELRLPLVCAVVTGWDLPEEFSKENLQRLMLKAPQIADAVNAFIWDDELFFGKE